MTLFHFPSENSSPYVTLNAFKEADVFKDLSWLCHNEGPIYDKAL